MQHFLLILTNLTPLYNHANAKSSDSSRHGGLMDLSYHSDDHQRPRYHMRRTHLREMCHLAMVKEIQ
jgi:hypothetical protein